MLAYPFKNTSPCAKGTVSNYNSLDGDVVRGEARCMPQVFADVHGGVHVGSSVTSQPTSSGGEQWPGHPTCCPPDYITLAAACHHHELL